MAKDWMKRPVAKTAAQDTFAYLMQKLTYLLMGLLIPLAFYFFSLGKNIIHASDSITKKLNEVTHIPKKDIVNVITQPIGTHRPRSVEPIGRLVVFTAPTCGKCASYKEDAFKDILNTFVKNEQTSHPLEVFTIDYPADIVSALACKLLFYEGGRYYNEINQWIYENQNRWLPSHSVWNRLSNEREGDVLLKSVFDTMIKEIMRDIPEINDVIRLKSIMDNQALEEEVLKTRQKIDAQYAINVVPSVFLEMNGYRVAFDSPPTQEEVLAKIKEIEEGRYKPKENSPFWSRIF
jgi:hypothetical protein